MLIVIEAKVQGKIEEWGGRKLVINFEQTDYETPNRIVNTTEIRARGRLMILKGFRTPVVECTSRLTSNFPERFSRANGTFKDNKDRLIRFRTNHRDKDIIYRPQLPKDVYFNDQRSIKMLLDMQKEADMSIITIPELPPGMSKEQYGAMIQGAILYCIKSSGRDDHTYMPYIDVGMKDHKKFQDRLDMLVALSKDVPSLAIGVRLSDYNVYRSNYESLNDYNIRSKDIWIHGSGAMDFTGTGSRSARQHVPQRFGIDTAALLVKTAPKADSVEKEPATEATVIDDAMKYVRLFNRPTVEYWKAKDLSQDEIDNFSCTCPACQGRSLIDNVQAYVSDEGGVDEQNLRDFVRLHNAYQSSDEFKVSQERCEDCDLKDYFSTRPGLQPFT